MTAPLPVVAVVGGSGAEGSALAARWARAGRRVVIGSRSAGRAAAAAAALAVHGRVDGAANRDAAEAADIVVLTVPFAAQRAILADVRGAVAGKIVVDATAPLVPPRVSRVRLPPEGSAAQAAQAALGAGVRVVSAFQNVAAGALADPEAEVACDVLVCGDDAEARAATVRLVEAAGLRGLEAGPLANAAAAEALTSALIWINRRYGAEGAGIRITGLPGAATPG